MPATYPIGEAWGLGAGVLAAVQPDADGGVVQFIVGLTLAYIGLVDLRRFSIPLGGMAVLALAVAASLAHAGPLGAAPRLATGAALALLLALLQRLVRKDGRAGLGGGDIPLGGLVGALVGWRLAPGVVALAAFLPLTLQLLSRRRGPVPFGFWLALVATPFSAWLAANRGWG